MKKKLSYLLTILAIMAGLVTATAPAASAVLPDPLSCAHGSTVMSWTPTTPRTYHRPLQTSLTNFCLQSPAEGRRIIWQYNGDLVVRPGTTSGNGQWIWHTNTQNQGDSLRFFNSKIQVLDKYGTVLASLGNPFTATRYFWTLDEFYSESTWKYAFKQYGEGSSTVFETVYQRRI